MGHGSILQSTISKKKYEKLSRKLAQKGVLFVELGANSSELLKEINSKGYEPLYIAESGDNEGRNAVSFAVVWPRKNGKPNKTLFNIASDVGKYHFKIMIAHQAIVTGSNSNEKFLCHRPTVACTGACDTEI